MFKKISLSCIVLSASLMANSIDFNYADNSAKRVSPLPNTQILSYNDSIKKAVKSVVNISTKKKVNTQRNNPLGQLFNDPFFRQFFGKGFQDNLPKERFQRSLGSGVILSKDGYIVTNAHVINNADEIMVTIGENADNEYSAKLIGVDKDSDLAVIKIDAKNLNPITVGTSSNLLVGDVVFAIGNPFGVGQTVTYGIISALNKNKVGINRYENFIQTDASINPGNSGGALIDNRGALIGINTAILTRSGGNNGVGFAIPSKMVKTIVKKLVEDGKVTRGYLGVAIEDINDKMQSMYKHDYGALVLDVSKDTPAYTYDLKRGDLILQINDKKIKDANELQRVIGSFKPNDKITLTIERDKKILTREVVLSSRDMIHEVASNKEVLGGLYLSEMSPQNRKKYRIPQDFTGILIHDVKPSSKAEKAGFQSGDVIIQIENMEIKGLADIQKALTKFKNKAKRVYINRYGRIIPLVIQ